MTKHLWFGLRLLGLALWLGAPLWAADSLGGVVSCEDGGLADATVRLIPVQGANGESERTVQTDEDGRFIFKGLYAQAYRLDVKAIGYLLAQPFTAQRQYAPGAEVTIALVKGGAVTGKVTDANGEPVIGLQMRLRRVSDGAGNPLKDGAARFGEESNFASDDRGIYRIFGLPAGKYLVSTEYMPGRDTAYDGDATFYYPDGSLATAQEVTVQQGLETGGIDFHYRSVRGLTLSGKVLGSTGKDRMAWRIVKLLRAGTDYQLDYLHPESKGEQFSYRFSNMPAGEYELEAARYFEGEDGCARSMRQRVKPTDKDATLDLTMNPLAQLAGQITLEAFTPEEETACRQLPKVSLEAVWLTAQRLPETTPSTNDPFAHAAPQVPANTWRITGLDAGRYRVSVAFTAPNIYLKAIRLPSAPPNQPFPLTLKASEKRGDIHLTVSPTAAAVFGKVTREKASDKVQVHLVPMEEAFADNVLVYAQAETNAAGNFALLHLKPGKYWLLALPAIEGIHAQSVAFDAGLRNKLRQAAARSGKEITLGACQPLRDQQVNVSTP